MPEECLRLLYLSDRQWRNLLHWLDTSGLTLYFQDRLVELQLCNWMPAWVIERLLQNLANNTQRTRSLVAESGEIHRAFQKAGLSYALLKGFSLCPDSVPRPELRHQFDLDFLVGEGSAVEARRILERRGYHLGAIHGRSWEFQTEDMVGFSLKNLYRDLPCRSVELHIEPGRDGRGPLGRAEQRELNGINMPVLSPVDLFLGQGLHAYKHLCSESLRTAYLLEFRRHVLHRRNDDCFWEALRSMAAQDAKASLGLGVVTLLTAKAMDDFAPEPLTNWTVACLPPSVRLWVETYGSRAVFESFPGSKLYLLLQKELEGVDVSVKRSRRQALFPTRLPRLVIKASSNESISSRIRRYRAQLRFVVFRLSFHFVEGLRYALESYRWRRQLERIGQ